MVKARWRPDLTPEEGDDLFMLMLEDDTSEAPWMTMGDLHWLSMSGFAGSLRSYADEQGLGWYVAARLPIRFRWHTLPRTQQLAPDTMVAFVDNHSRESFEVKREGGFPPFVLEVISPASKRRDQQEKREAYRLLEVQEYALFWPKLGEPSVLTGYRRTASGRFITWKPDAAGRLWSEVLGLFLVARGMLLWGQTPDGAWLPNWSSGTAADYEAKAALRQAEAAYRAEVEARQRAEAETERLLGEAERLRRELARLSCPPTA